MSRIFEVPTPADDHDVIREAGRALQHAARAFEEHHSALLSAGALAGEQWVGASAAGFGRAHQESIAYLHHVKTAHHAHAAIHHAYAGHVVTAKTASRTAHSQLQQHLDEYAQNVTRALRHLHELASENFDKAKHEAQQALHDAEHLNLIGAFSHATHAVSDAYQGIGDELVADFLGKLSAWQPALPTPETKHVHPGVYEVVQFQADMVHNELSAIGDFLASVLLEEFREILQAMGLWDAANAVRAVEMEFAAEAAAAQNAVNHAIGELAQAAEHLATQVGHEIEKGLDAAGDVAREIGGAITTYVTEHRAEFKWVSEALGDVAMVTGALALVPGLDVVFGPIALGATALKLADDSLLAATHNGSWSDVGWDAVEVVTMGGGAAIVAKAGTAAHGVETAEAVAKTSTKLERETTAMEKAAGEARTSSEKAASALQKARGVRETDPEMSKLYARAAERHTADSAASHEAARMHASNVTDAGKALDHAQVAQAQARHDAQHWIRYTAHNTAHPWQTLLGKEGVHELSATQFIRQEWSEGMKIKAPYLANLGLNGLENGADWHDNSVAQDFLGLERKWGPGVMEHLGIPGEGIEAKVGAE